MAMRPYQISRAVLLFCVTFFSAGMVYAMVYQMAADDCPHLAADPVQWEKLLDLWQRGETTVLVRHAWDCDPDVEAGCVNGNETLTEQGRQQAAWVGDGFRRSLGGEFAVSHSYLHRTRDTAMIAFGHSERNDSVTKPCKTTIQDYLNGQPVNGNKVFVTHSSCINSMSDERGERMLGFNASKKAHFAIAAFFERDSEGKQQLLGCVWPGDWASIPEQRFEYHDLVAQKVSDYLIEWL